MQRIPAIIAMLCLSLTLSAAPAFAQGSSARGYDESLGVIGEIQSEDPQVPERERQPSSPAPPPPPPPQERAQEGELPFTGMDVGIVALMGLALLGAGFVVRRTTRAPQE